MYQQLSFVLPLLSCSHLAMYQASLYLKTNQPVCVFTHSKGTKIGPSCQELRGVSKCPRTLKHPVGQTCWPSLYVPRERDQMHDNILWYIDTVPVKICSRTHMLRTAMLVASLDLICPKPNWSSNLPCSNIRPRWVRMTRPKLKAGAGCVRYIVT